MCVAVVAVVVVVSVGVIKDQTVHWNYRQIADVLWKAVQRDGFLFRLRNRTASASRHVQTCVIAFSMTHNDSMVHAVRAYMIALEKRLLLLGVTKCVSTSDAPALSPNIVIASGSPPNALMFRRTHRMASRVSCRPKFPLLPSGVELTGVCVCGVCV